MIKKLLFLFAVMFISANLMAQWTYLSNSGFTGVLRSVSLVNANVAFISGDTARVLKTTNGGLNWTNIAPSQIPATMGGDVVRALDENQILVVSNGTAGAFVYKTINSGANWTQVFTQAGGYIDDIRFKDANNGFMLGDPVGSRWSLWKTTNGGTTWDSAGLYLPQVSTEAGWDNDMCVQGNNIWFGTNTTHIYRSTNFGASWISTNTAGVTSSTCINFSGNTGFVTGGGVTLKSTDAGATWSAFTNPGTDLNIHIQSLGTRFWIAQTNMYYSSNNGSTFPLSYTYGTHGEATGPMWGIGANHTGTQLTVYVSGYTGGIWKYTETVEPPPPTGTWTEQISPVTTELNSVSAVDDDVAWASGAAGKVVRTTNKGANWTNVSNDLPITNPGYCIWGFDANNAVVTTSPAAAAGARIFKTTNGGTNWVQTFFQSDGWGDGFYFMNATTGFFYGDHTGTRLSIFKTTNGGTTWDSTGQYYPTTSDGYNNAMFGLGNQIWLGTNGTSIVYTSNAGVNWTSQTTTAANQPAIWFNSATIGMAGGGDIMWKTTNSGTNWAVIPDSINNNTTGLCGAGTNWWITAWTSSVYYSPNDGTSWSTQYVAPAGSFRHITKARNGSTIWGVRTNGGISRYGSIIIGITPISENIPVDYQLSQNYPNPFNPTTKISFALPKSGFVSLKVYDILGKEVTTLVNSNMSVGSYSYEFDASNLTSGIYFYRLESNGFIDTKKMMLIK